MYWSLPFPSLPVPPGVVYGYRYNRSKGSVHRSTTYSVDQPTERGTKRCLGHHAKEMPGTQLVRSHGWLGSVVVGCRTCDREIASSTPGRSIAR